MLIEPGQVAVVTGAAQGIGRALAAELVGRGASVALVDLHEGGVRQTAGELGDTAVPFVADESATNPGEVTRELLGGSATALSIKTARTGFTTSHRVLAQAEGLGTEVVMGNQIDGQLGTTCTAVFGAAFAATSRRAGELSNFLDMRDDLLTEPLEIRDGTLPIRPGPGLGVEIDPDKLAHYRQD